MPDFAEAIGNIFIVHARIEAIDRKALTKTLKKQRAKQMADLQHAANSLMLTEYATLSEAAKISAKELKSASSELKSGLDGITDPIEVLNVVGATIGTIANLVSLIGAGARPA